jgi:hypothetical protein
VATVSCSSRGSVVNGNIGGATTAAEVFGLGGIAAKFVPADWRRVRLGGERGALGTVDGRCGSVASPNNSGGTGPCILPIQLPICASQGVGLIIYRGLRYRCCYAPNDVSCSR